MSENLPALNTAEDNSATFLTDRLVARHKAETEALDTCWPDGAFVDRHEWANHALRQAQELLDHAYAMERKLHEVWSEHRWCGKS